jgi:NADH-quinone oxidoreductase subunit N
MMPFVPPVLTLALPEIALAVIGMIALMLGVFSKHNAFTKVSVLSAFGLLAVATAVVPFFHFSEVGFFGQFVSDPFAVFTKVLVLLSSATCIVMARSYAARERIDRFEYPVLILFSTLGMLLMISANDLMSLYLALELQSLPLYILAALQRDTVRSTEAGLKYFVLGALSSGMLLYGASLIYGYAGTTSFQGIAEAFSGSGPEVLPLAAITGMVLLLCGLAFKIAAVPFHMWTPDVYEGAPTSVTAFFAIVPKIAAVALIARVLTGPFGNITDQWQQVVIALSVASMLLGAVAAIAQTNIKRMLAYSSIGHMGYVLVGIAAGTAFGVKAVMIYLSIYVVTGIAAFAVVLMMKSKDRMLENIRDLAGLSSSHPMLALAMSLIMFSLAGIPPLAGFFGKLFVFQAAIDAKLYALAIIGVLSSVISAYYYLRVIKIMYFDPASSDNIDTAKGRGLVWPLTLASLAIVFFVVMPSPLVSAADVAARALFP